MKTIKENFPMILKKSIFAFLGLAFLGFGIAFNAAAGLGNDPISVFYDGLSKATHLDFGMASNLANLALFCIVFLFGRNHIHVGTIVYVLTLGLFIDMGFAIHKLLGFPDSLEFQIISAILGCLMLFFGIALFMSLKVGQDPWTGTIMTLVEKLKLKFIVAKISLDLTCLAVGFLLHGIVGVTTLVAAVLGGPMIHMFAKMLENTVFKWVKINA